MKKTDSLRHWPVTGNGFSMIKCPVCNAQNSDDYIRCQSCNKETNPRRRSAAGGGAQVVTDEGRKKAEALKNQGNEAFTKRDFSTAVQFYMKALQNNPAHDGAWNNMGLAYRSMNDLKSATKCFSKAIEINPNNGSALANREACVYEMNRSVLGLAPKKEEPVGLPATAAPAAPVKKEEESTAQESSTGAGPAEAATGAASTESKEEEQKEVKETETPEPVAEHPFQQAAAAPSEPVVKEPKTVPRETEPPAPQPESLASSTAPPAPLAGTTRQIQPGENIPPSTTVKPSRAETPEEPPDEEPPPRTDSGEEQYYVERRLGPLGLRSTMIIKTAAEMEFLKEYKEQRRRKSWPPSVHMKSSYYEQGGEEEGEDHDPTEFGDAYTDRFRVEARKRRNKRATSVCEYCRNIINTDNRSIRCMDCGEFFCATCEGDFRGLRREGDSPLCANCYLKFIKEKERERIAQERADGKRKKLEKKLKRKKSRKLEEELEKRKRQVISDVSSEEELIEKRSKSGKDEAGESKTERQGMPGDEVGDDLMGQVHSRKKDWLKKAVDKEVEDIPMVEVEVLAGDTEDMDDLVEVTGVMLLAEDEDLPEAEIEVGEDAEPETVEAPGTEEDKEVEIPEVDEEEEVEDGEDGDIFERLAKKFEDGLIDEGEYERLIERALEGDTDIL